MPIAKPHAASHGTLSLPTAHFIGGRWVHPHSRDRVHDLNPSDGTLLAELPMGTEADIDAAVENSREAFVGWSRLRPAERERILHSLADAVDAQRERLGTIESIDVGKPLRRAIDVEGAAASDVIRFYAGFPTKNFGQYIPTADPSLVCYTRMDPIGVVGAITPWNYPLLIALNKLAPALAAGCTVVLKPPVEAPLSTLALAEIAVEAGVPPGVLNVVVGAQLASSALAGHPGIAKVTFTGSTRTGSAVLSEAAKALRPAGLELGGKCPNVVFDDADVDAVADLVVSAATYNSGQECCAGSRVLVHEHVIDRFIEAITKRVRQLVVGPADDPTTEIGPLITAFHRDRVHESVERAVQGGAEILVRGEVPDGSGFFYPPLVIRAGPENQIWHDEVFGPVFTVTPFRDDEQALTLANHSQYGLAAGIWTNELARAIRFSQELDFGMIWVNSYMTGDPAAPFGGVRDSGFTREMGLAGLQECCTIRTIYIKGAPTAFRREVGDS